MVYRYKRRTTTSTRQTRRYRRKTYRRRTTAVKALRIARSVNRRLAAEVCKWQITPDLFSNLSANTDTPTMWSQFVTTNPLSTINSGVPWIMPINWVYTTLPNTATTGNVYINGKINGINTSGTGTSTPELLAIRSVSSRNPIWYNAMTSDQDGSNDNYTLEFTSAELQYRMAYIYIKGIFNASVASSQNNTDGAMRIVIVKDKQPQGGAATWFDSNGGNASRGVFNSLLIDAQINTQTSGRFKIMYDKTIRFTTINGYKPFKYFKRLSTIVRNTRRAYGPIGWTQSSSTAQTNDAPPPVLKNAFYMMIFTDGLNFTYSNDPTTPAAGFHLFSRVGYYNN